MPAPGQASHLGREKSCRGVPPTKGKRGNKKVFKTFANFCRSVPRLGMNGAENPSGGGSGRGLPRAGPPCSVWGRRHPPILPQCGVQPSCFTSCLHPHQGLPDPALPSPRGWPSPRAPHSARALREEAGPPLPGMDGPASPDACPNIPGQMPAWPVSCGRHRPAVPTGLVSCGRAKWTSLEVALRMLPPTHPWPRRGMQSGHEPFRP